MRKQINHARRHACFSESALRQNGYHQIGRGAFSKAFVHRDAPDVVIKVGKLYSKRLALTDGFPHFAQQLLDGEITSKFFPKVYDILIDAARGLFWCIMKRYHKQRGAKKMAEQISTTHKAITGSISGTKPIGRFRKAMEKLIDARFISDIHAGNVLWDAKGTPIVIDPICITPRYHRDFYA
ncbi:hypothetical protein [Mesorhizobium sp. M7A.F.Ca.MR.362.00.0.0]|uniref:hypothetical protein n=1 Tax=Mesorhizobium sp. M7A.F.Ca.MR.362.00.0.0 TaxID=2496779 RepID=UPI000FD347C3|nr:hypothetical protein [Mesorhizobium sp. M7A.F.Ca.MR.362.00.0.0]RUU78230.1 hypothetical protein EOC06_20660 [Mesorhizobium sp. M7A.F.Ca.MR.362.00.0.0]RWN95420.1 MAG: hypothetical protein EOS05_11545 [Mesorhizobium sp.]